MAISSKKLVSTSSISRRELESGVVVVSSPMAMDEIAIAKNPPPSYIKRIIKNKRIKTSGLFFCKLRVCFFFSHTLTAVSRYMGKLSFTI